ncbi:MAG TPA: glycoside hydrolase family 3 N-terminal domain-containing protein, partial [Salinivirgaceae bacterium]|nr:glycoside hydrolase family 3 N-terminal domain-containing protein [Salinivirgaceae bacterium]
MKKLILPFIGIGFLFTIYSLATPDGFNKMPENLESEKSGNYFTFDTTTYWVDSVFKSLTLQEKIGQLFMISLLSSKDKKTLEQTAQLVEKHNIGGIIFMKGSPLRQAHYTNYLQSKSKTPLLIAIDGEWGLAMRLDSIEPFPRQMMLGAANNEELVYEMGVEIAKQCKLMGIHINFAPVVDINNNPNNPVINSRSFGEDKNKVLRLGYAYMSGMQDQGLIVTAKHFPGHGDTDVDSHYGLPIISHPRRHLENFELYPFRNLIKLGLNGIMVAHVSVPSYDSTPKLPATLSYPIVTELLQNRLEFRGLIFTDALDMAGASTGRSPEEAALLAFKAGNDILLMPPDPEKAIKRFEVAIKSGEISIDELNHRCKKILAAKEKAGLNHFTPIDTNNLLNKLNNKTTQYLNHKFAEKAITLLQNKNELIPIVDLSKPSLVISINGGKNEFFFNRVKNYNRTRILRYYDSLSPTQINKILLDAAQAPYVIVPWFGLTQLPKKNYGGTRKSIEFITELTKRTKVILVLFGNPFLLNIGIETKILDGLIVAYENTKYTQDYAAQLIFGGIEAQGVLPVTVGNFKAGFKSLKTEKVRLGFSIPQAVGANESYLYKIDSLINTSISQQMTPGAQVLCSHKGTVFFYRSYGFQTYDSTISVTDTTIYDLASLTKVLVTTPLLMHLHEAGKINISDPIGKYLILPKEIASKRIMDMIAHRAGFVGWILFMRQFVDSTKNLQSQYFSSTYQDSFPIPVADSLWASPSVVDSVFNTIYQTPLKSNNKYLYSDLPFYLFMQLIENIETKQIDYLIDSLFYKPMGINTLVYNPLKYFSRDQIAPSEIDSLYRKRKIHGFVNDPGAALLGGKCGHAGLFGNALDVAKMGQMYLNQGYYGNVRLLKPKTLELFTTAHFKKEKNRRGLGFDKPDLWDNHNGPTIKNISPKSFGHTGFTGTYLWVDPEKEIVYVFISNRTFPSAKNNSLV